MEIRQNAQYMKVREFARKTGLSESTVRRYEREGKIFPHHKTPTGIRYYSQDQVDKWLHRNDLDDEATKDLLTDKVFASQIGLTVQTVYNYAVKGLIQPAYITANGRRFYSKDQIDAYFSGQYLTVRAKPGTTKPETAEPNSQ